MQTTTTNNDLPGSFVCLTKIKKDLENTRKQNNFNNDHIMEMKTNSDEDAQKEIGKWLI